MEFTSAFSPMIVIAVGLAQRSVLLFCLVLSPFVCVSDTYEYTPNNWTAILGTVWQYKERAFRYFVIWLW